MIDQADWQPQRRRMRKDEPLPAGVVRVDRATMWGNPFRSGHLEPAVIKLADTAAQAYRLWLAGHPDLAHVEPERRGAILDRIGLLHGKDLACWCAYDAPCHADVLLEHARAAAPIAGDALGRPDGVPHIALSVRQPWAWALVFGGKDIENRSQAAVRHGMQSQVGKRVAIHASKGMTREEYEQARVFMDCIGVACPAPGDLPRGGIIGSALLWSIVSTNSSPWFTGPRGLVMVEPRPVPFIGAVGELGMFQWAPNFAQPDPPAKWMLPAVADVEAAKANPPVRDLFSASAGG